MKKLKLKLVGKEMLTKEQMKNISGGYLIGCEITCCKNYNGHVVGTRYTMSCDQSDGNAICDIYYSDSLNTAWVCGCECTYHS